MRIIKYPARADWSELLKRPIKDYKSIKKVVKPILAKVKKKGDLALKKLALEYDHVELDNLLVSPEEFKNADKAISKPLREAIQVAARNILKFHEAQKDKDLVVETIKGVVCSRRSVAIEKVGLYIPGGTAPLFSTVLMLGIPAKIAGCQEIVMCTPTDEVGKINPVILYTAKLVGIEKIVKVGGAQAIGALAYGTESVPKVDKIFGPGNQYVTTAKQMVVKDGLAIDMPAGPSEVAILADKTAIPEFIAADLLAQAEHGVDSQVILVTTEEKLIAQVMKAIDIQLESLPRKAIVEKALYNSLIILVKTTDEAMDLLNAYAPEHLIIATKDYEKLALKVRNAGSVFLGNYTPESCGDYASGTNHTLPTNGYANAYSGVSLDSFVKKITFQQITKEGLEKLGPVVEVMAEAEQLHAHKEAVTIRLKSNKK